MMFGIMCSIAGYEKELINERMKSGKITKLHKGERAIGGKLPFGYTKKNGGIVLDSVDGKVVEFIYKTINRYNKKGYSPKDDKDWYDGSVITNPITPDTSLVIDGLSDLRLILSTSSIYTMPLCALSTL